MTKEEWERIAKKQLGVEPDATIPVAERSTCVHCGGPNAIVCNRCHGAVSYMTKQPSQEAQADPLASKCPHCKVGENSEAEGGNVRCFHCGSCGYVGCMWTDKEKREMLAEQAAQIRTLTASLEKIRDAYDYECECQHDTEDCCARLKDAEPCAFCIASVGLAGVASPRSSQENP